MLVHHGGHLISAEQLHLTTQRLRRGGVEYSISAVQFIAAKVVAGIGFGLVAWYIGSYLGYAAFVFGVLAAFAGFFYPELWLKEAANKRKVSILRTLPFYLDIITLSVEAGSNLTGGMTQAVQKSADSRSGVS